MPSDDSLAQIIILNEPEGSFFSLDNGESRIGPFKNEEAATKAALSFLEESFAELVKNTLFGG